MQQAPQNDPASLRKLAKSLTKDVTSAQVRLGHVLQAIKSAKYHHEWGYDSWWEYVVTEVQIQAHVSYQRMRISRWLGNIKPTKKQLDRLMTLGRCKLYLLSGAAIRKGTLDEWIDYAQDQTVISLRNHIQGRSKLAAKKAKPYWMDGHQERIIERAIHKALLESVDAFTKADCLVEVCQEYLDRRKPSRRKAA
jgi:hypothetical protein